MPWGDLVELLGGSAIILAVLAVFWKGDDCISKEFRDDLAAWLILLKPPPGNSPVVQSVLAMFEKFFGERHLSWKCLSRSFVLSAVFFFSVVLLMRLFLPDSRQPLGDEEITASNIFMLLLAGLLFNGIGDYPALYVTRKVLQQSLKKSMSLSWAIFFDLVFTALIIFVIILVIIWLFTQAFGATSSGLLTTAFVFLYGFLGAFGFDADGIDSPLGFAVLFTAFITSIWLWAAALGTLLIRLLARSGPILSALQYALPIEEKPIRSMGIVGFLVFFTYLVITIAL